MQTALTVTPALTIQEMLSAPSVQSAFQFFDSHADSITDEHIRICSIPASPFAERERADYLNQRFQEIGLVDNQIDEEGNCIALRKGSLLSPLLVVSAHLDTVFP